jgi:phosphoribosylaminoimidazole carboxylase (NCAIR synthetase)
MSNPLPQGANIGILGGGQLGSYARSGRQPFGTKGAYF